MNLETNSFNSAAGSVIDNSGPVRKKRNFDMNHTAMAPCQLDFAAGTISEAGAVDPVDEFPEETRSVCSIAHHMENLGRTDDDVGAVVVPTTGTMIEHDASHNQTSTSSSLDARIQALSEMQPEERCAQLNQDAIQPQAQPVPMDADYMDGIEEEATPRAQVAVNETDVTTVDADMPDLEGSDADFEQSEGI